MTADPSIQNAPAAGGPGWLVSRDFDRIFIFGTAAFSIALGLAGLAVPQLFIPLLIINIWVLGYHHVIATFTRLCFDKQSHRRSLLLIYALLPMVLAAVIFLAMSFGPWILTSMYLYLQWFHYARQSWGISRAYERKAPAGYAADRSWQTQAIFYGVPVLGILHWSSLAPTEFLGMPLKVIPVPHELFLAAGAAGAALLAVWGMRIFKDWRRGVLPQAYTYYMMTHFTIFIFAYLLMPTLDSAWLVANAWHNLQYILFVWSFNTRRYKNGVEPGAQFLSFISQRQNMVIYFVVTLAMTFMVYGSINYALKTVFVTLPLIVVYQTINFHHYIVDAIIWRGSWIKKGQPAAPPAATNR